MAHPTDYMARVKQLGAPVPVDGQPNVIHVMASSNDPAEDIPDWLREQAPGLWGDRGNIDVPTFHPGRGNYTGLERERLQPCVEIDDEVIDYAERDVQSREAQRKAMGL
jgi:hypothetical protein